MCMKVKADRAAPYKQTACTASNARKTPSSANRTNIHNTAFKTEFQNSLMSTALLFKVNCIV